MLTFQIMDVPQIKSILHELNPNSISTSISVLIVHTQDKELTNSVLTLSVQVLVC